MTFGTNVIELLEGGTKQSNEVTRNQATGKKVEG